MGIPNRIREIAESNSMTIRGLSEKTGIKYRTIQNYLAGNRSVGSEFLTALSEQMEVSASWLLTGAGPTLLTKLHPNEYSKVGIESETESDFIPIPCYSVEASAGSGALVETKASIGQYAFNAQWIKRRNLDQRMLNVITVRGDSMEPELYDRDLILLDRSQIRPRDGDMYVVRYSGDLFVKRVQVIPGNKLELLSANRFYNPIRIDLPREDEPYDLDLEFIGKVIASMHEW